MKNRQLIYVPEINPRTFLFFYFKGISGRSYSLRDYSTAAGVRLTDSKHYPYTVDDILGMAHWSIDAPAHPTEDLAYWRRRILELNQKYLGADAMPSVPPVRRVQAREITATEPRGGPAATSSGTTAVLEYDEVSSPEVVEGLSSAFPLIAPQRLFAHPVKGAKRQDLERIVSSRASEDWVTWNVLQLLEHLDARRWWPEVVALARAENPGLDFEADCDDPPRVDLWRAYPAPADYERSSRARMAASGNPDLRNRAAHPAPVEGTTEVDLVLEGTRYLIFIEAKLGSDISMTTTYDPARNQVARNIDVLLESAADRSPAFWMFVRDTAPERAYVQLLREYRENPRSLHSLLPHRTLAEVERVARRLALVRWQPLVDLVDRELQAVLAELRARTSPGAR